MNHVGSLLQTRIGFGVDVELYQVITLAIALTITRSFSLLLIRSPKELSYE